MKIIYCLILLMCASFLQSAKKYTPGKLDIRIEIVDGIKKVTGTSCFSLENHFVWCGSVCSGDDQKYYLFYSAMESGCNSPVFNQAWVLGSKLGVAVSDTPYGNFKDLGFFYNIDGYTADSSSWDAQTSSNTHIQKFDGKYYLYYCGSSDPGEFATGAKGLTKRDRVQQNQKIGVLCFNSIAELLEGKYTKNEHPLLSPRTRVKPNTIVNPSSEGTVAMPDNIIVVNPSVVYRPCDSTYLLYFKGNIYDPYWRGLHGVATSKSPTGPFIALDEVVFDLKILTNEKLSAEDPYVWYHRKDKCFYAVFKDFTGHFTKSEPCLAIMQSQDGINWTLPENSLFAKKELSLLNGDVIAVNRLERPQLFFDENDNPIVLYAACAIEDINKKNDGSSFNVHIPITITK